MDIATNADLAVEDLIVSEIKKVYRITIFSQKSKTHLDQKIKIHLGDDPIDGTKNYFVISPSSPMQLL